MICFASEIQGLQVNKIYMQKFVVGFESEFINISEIYYTGKKSLVTENNLLVTSILDIINTSVTHVLQL